jgi:hypothetical protein
VGQGSSVIKERMTDYEKLFSSYLFQFSNFQSRNCWGIQVVQSSSGIWNHRYAQREVMDFDLIG